VAKTRQNSDPLEIRGNASTFPDGSTLAYSVPGWDQLLHATTGVMSIETERGTWIVPPNRALWVPDGQFHLAQMHGRVAVRALYVRSELAAMQAELQVINVAPLLRELILHVVTSQEPLDRRIPRHAHLIDFLLDQLQEVRQAPLRLPQPRDPRAKDFAELLAASPAASLDDLAILSGASRRTLERLFVAETGMPIARWRRQLRLVQALRLLGAGHRVTEVAHLVGYATPSAFTSMFRAELGQTPARYFE
jgi:AraC-like DNA-binding protein